jgi:hypothetical protein
MPGIEILAVIGFALAVYSVIANDAIQTLGTFLRSNKDRPWWILWIYIAGIFVAVLAYAYFTQNGDVAYGRLNKIPYPEGGIQWYHVIPPIVLIVLTRMTIPVSTTFLVLTMFALTGGAATEGVLGKMMLKSALGYAVAFGVGILVYAAIARTFSRWVHNTQDESPANFWFAFKWLTTGFLWTQWLMQDLANIFVFLPRTNIDGVTMVSPGVTIMGGALSVILIGYIFYRRGGRIQEIVNSKTGTQDPRVGVLVDIMFGIILFVFKEVNDIPMSTTWVFLGLIAGRELAVAYIGGLRERAEALRDVTRDAGRLLFGLVVSVAIAFFIPWAATGNMPTF